MIKIVALTFLVLCMLALSLPILAIWHIARLKIKLIKLMEEDND